MSDDDDIEIISRLPGGRVRVRSRRLGVEVVATDLRTARRLFDQMAETNVAQAPGRAALLMRRHWETTRPIRLIGLRAARLSPADSVTQLAFPGV